MNTGIPIYKIHKIQHFDTICETSLFEIANFHEKTTSLLKHMTVETDQCRNEHSFCLAVFALGENVKTYPTTQCKFLLILKMGVPVFIGPSWMQFTELW